MEPLHRIGIDHWTRCRESRTQTPLIKVDSHDNPSVILPACSRIRLVISVSGDFLIGMSMPQGRKCEGGQVSPRCMRPSLTYRPQPGRYLRISFQNATVESQHKWSILCELQRYNYFVLCFTARKIGNSDVDNCQEPASVCLTPSPK